MLDVLQSTLLLSVIGPAYDQFQSVVTNFVVRRRAAKMIAQASEHARWSYKLASFFFRYWGHAARYPAEQRVPISLALQIRDEGWTWTHREVHRDPGFGLMPRDSCS